MIVNICTNRPETAACAPRRGRSAAMTAALNHYREAHPWQQAARPCAALSGTPNVVRNFDPRPDRRLHGQCTVPFPDLAPVALCQGNPLSGRRPREQLEQR
jgi:hypothetical protein